MLAIHCFNRLSDVFFAWSRYVSWLLGAPENLCEPNAASLPIKSTETDVSRED